MPLFDPYWTQTLRALLPWATPLLTAISALGTDYLYIALIATGYLDHGQTIIHQGRPPAPLHICLNNEGIPIHDARYNRDLIDLHGARTNQVLLKKRCSDTLQKENSRRELRILVILPEHKASIEIKCQSSSYFIK